MTITKLGFKEVDEVFLKAKEHLTYAEEQLIRATNEVAKLEKCHNCNHENLKEMGGYIHLEIRCVDCGFTWID